MATMATTIINSRRLNPPSPPAFRVCLGFMTVSPLQWVVCGCSLSSPAMESEIPRRCPAERLSSFLLVPVGAIAGQAQDLADVLGAAAGADEQRDAAAREDGHHLGGNARAENLRAITQPQRAGGVGDIPVVGRRRGEYVEVVRLARAGVGRARIAAEFRQVAGEEHGIRDGDRRRQPLLAGVGEGEEPARRSLYGGEIGVGG